MREMTGPERQLLGQCRVESKLGLEPELVGLVSEFHLGLVGLIVKRQKKCSLGWEGQQEVGWRSCRRRTTSN